MERTIGLDAHATSCTFAVLSERGRRLESAVVEMVSYWVNHFDMQVVPAGRKIRAVARPFTQPEGLRVTVLGRREALGDGGSRVV